MDFFVIAALLAERPAHSIAEDAIEWRTPARGEILTVVYHHVG